MDGARKFLLGAISELGRERMEAEARQTSAAAGRDEFADQDAEPADNTLVLMRVLVRTGAADASASIYWRHAVS
jgi:hypothetical protein